MGSTLGLPTKEGQRELQMEMQDRMARTQAEAMLINGERMKRTQIAQMVAVCRERFWWFAAFHSFFTLGILGAIKHRQR